MTLFLSENRDLSAAKRFFRQALARHGRPDRKVIDGSHTNHAAICLCDAENRLRDRSRRSLKPFRIRQDQYLTDIFDKGRSALMFVECNIASNLRKTRLAQRELRRHGSHRGR
ncbi:DDE-type integrase/transposase/recombinase [Mesorhizobium caraganae]|nr:DDE-type integrase/transposase/recombinase [Mesorhizobium caraganae]